MSRLLFFAVLAFLVYLLVRSYRRQVTRDDEVEPRVEDMVRCTHCGVHLPMQESLLVGGKYFCCSEHQQQYVKGTRPSDE